MTSDVGGDLGFCLKKFEMCSIIQTYSYKPHNVCYEVSTDYNNKKDSILFIFEVKHLTSFYSLQLYFRYTHILVNTLKSVFTHQPCLFC